VGNDHKIGGGTGARRRPGEVKKSEEEKKSNLKEERGTEAGL